MSIKWELVNNCGISPFLNSLQAHFFISLCNVINVIQQSLEAIWTIIAVALAFKTTVGAINENNQFPARQDQQKMDRRLGRK